MKDAEKRIKELERRVRELEERPVWYPVYIPAPSAPLYPAQPLYPFPYPQWPQVWCGGSQIVGTSDSTGRTLT